MAEKITKRTADALTAPDGREVTLWDSELRGFGLRARGQVKTYVLMYRPGEGGRTAPKRRYTICRHGSPWTPDTARAEAKRLLGLVADGGDPAIDKGTDRRSLTVADLCDLYLDEGCTTKKASTVAADRGRIARHIKPLLGQKKAKDVARADIERFMRDVAAGKTAADIKTGQRGRAIVEGGKGTATRTVGLLGGIFTFAVDRGICPANPVQGVKRYRDRKSERFLSAAEMAALGFGMTVMEQTDTLSLLMANAIRLLLLTGCRKSEILSLKWSAVDFERGYLRLPDSKTGEKPVPLGAPALKLLNDHPRVSEWVFPAATGAGHLVGLPRAWEAVREWCGLDGVRLHDFRHSFASVGAVGGDSLPVIGAILGHADTKTTSRYAHLTADPVKMAADRIAGRIAEAMAIGADETAQSPVVRLSVARRERR
ncbi:MAG: tyrosine-type recombinase/integrase [Alphaproteobacteria bacterium]|nr:tyrosine-type recombinase/integrase [Alphaproteobacteria bacterium]